MTPELHGHLVNLAEWVEEHLAALEAEYPQDGEGFSILPKGADGDAIRVLRQVTTRLTRIIVNVD